MKKSLTLLLAGILSLSALSLCGCNNSENSENSDSSSDTESSSSESSASSENSSESAESSDNSTDSENSHADLVVKQEEVKNIIGLAGDIVEKDDISSFKLDYEDADVSEFTMDKFLNSSAQITCNGFAYVLEPSGLCYTDRDNSDIYNAEEMTFTGVPDEKLNDFKRIKVGDSICGLTVKSAESCFNNMANAYFTSPNGETMTMSEVARYCPEIFFQYCEAEFEGDMELEGYLAIAGEDDYGIAAGDILFVPSGKCGLPVMNITRVSFDGIYSEKTVGYSYGLVWQNEYPVIDLGNISDTSVDLSDFSERNTYIPAKVTITDIGMVAYSNWINSAHATLLEANLR